MASPKAKDDKPQHGTYFLGRYRVVDEIGVGGMASVHLGRMDGPGGFQKWVAIKRIHPHLVEDDQFVDMFLDEARIAAGINHANVAQVFDLGKDDNTYWIAMEYLHGEPLREIMRRIEERNMRVPPEIAAKLCADAAEGLHAAHELRGKNGQLLGLVHRDVTPHNLFVTYEGYTKVVDFGIAKVADRLASTRAGTLKGKLAYMSPEQVRGQEVDRTTDIFALGVVLWELATNERLFRMDTDLDTLEKVQACNVPPPSTRVRDFPPELEAVVMKALAKKKADRYQTSREFSRALQGFLMRRGAFVGPEEVSQFVRHLFSDRIQKREAHLAWAQEVTSTINVGQLQKGSVVDELSVVSYEEVDDKKKQPAGAAPQPPPRPAATVPTPGAPAPPPRPAAAPAPPPASAPKPSMASAQMAAQSLMDDDEDVPTTVATREQLMPVGNAAAPRTAPRPAAGAPALTPAGPPLPNNPHASTIAMPGSSAQAVVATHKLERTIGLDEAEALGMLGSGGGPAPQPQQQQRGYGAYAPPGGAPAYGSSSVQVNMGQPGAPSFGQLPAAPSFGAPPTNPSFGAPPMAPSFGAPPSGGFGPAPAIPQSQIETAMSLPRPDPSVLRAAQQPKRNTALLAAVVALTALCVIGIGAIVYFKLLAKPDPPPASADPTPTATAQAAKPPPHETAKPAQPPPPATTPASTAAPTQSATSAPAPKGPATSGPAATGKEPKGDTGTLVLTCIPGCDDIAIGGRSYGKAPVKATLPVGQHRVTGRSGDKSKTVSILITGGATTAQSINMK